MRASTLGWLQWRQLNKPAKDSLHDWSFVIKFSGICSWTQRQANPFYVTDGKAINFQDYSLRQSEWRIDKLSNENTLYIFVNFSKNLNDAGTSKYEITQ